MRITEYPSVASLTSDMKFVVDGTNGTKSISATDLLFALETLNSPRITHRNTFRGKYLGSSVTSAQWAAISAGTFDDLWVGDYWTIGGVNWRIADINYWYRCGDTSLTTNHLIIVPDTALYTSKMNETNTTEGGYVGSLMYTSGLNAAKTTIGSAFGSAHIIQHREYLTNAVSNGKPSGGAWVDSTVELMTESMVYGHPHFSPTSDGSTVPSIHTIDKVQLALFQLAPEFINIRTGYWLRDVVSSAFFAYVNDRGVPDSYYASYGLGVRPCFAIG